jgi:hypothetical protein
MKIILNYKKYHKFYTEKKAVVVIRIFIKMRQIPQKQPNHQQQQQPAAGNW